MYASKSVFPNISSMQEPTKTIFQLPEANFCKRLQTSRKEAVGNTQRLFPYCQMADKFPAIFWVVFGILRGVLRFVRTCFYDRVTVHRNKFLYNKTK